MTIKELRQPRQPGGRVRLLFEDGKTLALPAAVAAEFALAPGVELDEDMLRSLTQAAGETSAKNRAVRIISAAGVTGRDLERRLIQKGETEQNARNAVAWLEELQLLDDRETARQIVARGVARGYGARRIRQMLYEKQVPKQYWDEALAEVPEMDDTLDRFLQQRLRGSTDRREIDRAVQALLRRGHDWSEIKTALRRYNSKIELEED